MPSGESDENEAVNLLSLDGGGVRGVSSLVILDEIMTKIKEMYDLPEVPKPCDFFHMIAGTSTGGLIAIMLGRLRMSTNEALQEYDNCAAKIFSRENRKKWSLSDKFQATALQEAVQDIVKERGLGEHMRDPESRSKGKAIVCVMPSGSIGRPHFVRSFYGDPGTEENWDDGVMIWEAARATTAASNFFKPQKLGRGKSAQSYIDAAIGVNNPVDYLLAEAVQEFGSARRLGCVVSIGTGTRDVKLERGFAPAYLFRIISTLKNTATDGQETHRRLQSRLSPFPGAYYRFTVPDAAEKVGLHHYKKIPLLKTLTAEYLARQDVARQIEQIAEGLHNDDFYHGLTLGHISGLDKEQVVLSKMKARPMGMTSPFFTGRQDILQRLESFFSVRDTAGKPRREFLLHGMGGVGKTEVAMKFSEIHEDRFKYIFYIDGSMPSTISQSYAEIAKRYGLGTTGGVDVMKVHAMRWMEELTEEWLMIFDDCNLSDRRGHVPGRGKGNIIYTSRSIALKHDLPRDCIFEVTPFNEADAVDLLLRASGCQSAPPDSEDRRSARAMIRELGCLPLAIDKAAAAIRDGDWALDEYLKQLRDRKVGILSDPRFKNKHVESPTVYATLELSYDAIMARRRREGRNGAGRAAYVALKLLGLFSFFHYREFPAPTVFGRAAKERAERDADMAVPLSEVMEPPDADFDRMLNLTADGKWDQHYFAVGLEVLRQLSLVKLDPHRKVVSMHVLVHSWARHRMKRLEYLRYSRIARILISESIVLSDTMVDTSFTRSLAPHIGVCFKRWASSLEHDEYKAQLLLKLGWHYQLDKKFLKSEDAYLRSLHIWRLEQGNHDWNAIFVLKRLGALYHEMGRLGDAELTYLEVVERIRERIRDCEAPLYEKKGGQEEDPRPSGSSTTTPSRVPTHFADKLSTHSSGRSFRRLLGGAQNDESRSEDTAGPGETVMVDRRLAVGTKPPSSPDDRRNLAIHHDIAHADLARVYMDQDRFGMGKRMLIQVLQNLEEEHDLERNHPQFLRIQHDVKSLTEPGNMSFWQTRLRRMLAIAETTDGEEFWTSDGGFNLVVAHANSILKNGMWDLAHDQYAVALDIFERFHGPCDRKVLEILRRMVDCMVEGDRCDKAVEIARDCVRRAKRLYGDWHRETVLALKKEYEAVFFRGLEMNDETVEILRAALVRAERCLGLTHSITTRIRRNLNRAIRWLKAPVLVRQQPSRLDAIQPTGIGSAWEDSKAELERLKATFGPNHIVVKRFARIVGDCPPKTREEYVARLRACFGPDDSLTKRVQEALDMERSALVRDTEGDGEGDAPRASRSRPTLDLCACGEPAHAEGSKGREFVERDEMHRSDVQDGDIKEKSAETRAQPVTLDAPRPVEAVVDSPLDAGDRGKSLASRYTASSPLDKFQNRPVYICGFYSGTPLGGS